MTRFDTVCPACGKSFKNSHVEMRMFCSVGCQAASLQEEAQLIRVGGQLSKERSPLAPGEGTWSVFAEKVVRERDQAQETVRTLQEHVETLREEWQRECAARLRLRHERDALLAGNNSIEHNVGALLDLYHGRALEAQQQAEHAWERHAEKDRAYGEVIRERDEAREHVALLRKALKAYYHECLCQRPGMDEVNKLAYRALRETEPKE